MTARRKHTLADVLGPLETDIMEVVWDRGEVTVRDVHKWLERNRSIAYTTVMTTLGRLADKGLVRRIEDQPAHRYSALISRDEYARSTVKSVVDWLVTRFPDPAVAYFLDRVEEEDDRVIDKLREAIEQRRAKGPVTSAATILALETDSSWVVILVVSLVTLPAP